MIQSTRMTRVPLDALPQQRLVNLLRVEIERSMARDVPTRRLRKLVADNPRSIWATHVTYNLGSRKSGWLRAHARDSRVDATLVRSFEPEGVTS